MAICFGKIWGKVRTKFYITKYLRIVFINRTLPTKVLLNIVKGRPISKQLRRIAHYSVEGNTMYVVPRTHFSRIPSVSEGDA